MPGFSTDLSAQDCLFHQGEHLALGRVFLPAQHADFGRERALAHHHLVWPRSSMRIRMQGQGVFVANPLALTLHSPGFAYRREPLAGPGDESEYLMLAPEWAAELLHGQPRPARFGPLHFGCAQRRLNGMLALRAQRLFVRARSGAPALALEEQALALAADCLRQAPPLQPAPAAVQRAQAVLAEVVQGNANLGLGEVARRAAVSPFHLTRLFSRHTGLSLHAYLMALRARQALQALAGEQTLAQIARRLGYVDAAHLSRQLRRAFGCTAGELRRV